MSDELDNISRSMITRYSERLVKLGYNVKTLGWGSREQQINRFKQALSRLDFGRRKSILDIGCGFGDLYSLLLTEGRPISQYTGWDINPELIDEARRIWHSESNVAAFEVVDISRKQIKQSHSDIVCMFGLLNLNLREDFNNYEYSKLLIENAFQMANEVLVVDFLSSILSPIYPAEDFVFYHNPMVMLEYALTLSSDVDLIHSYRPIPQKEFMLFIYK